MSIVVSPI